MRRFLLAAAGTAFAVAALVTAPPAHAQVGESIGGYEVDLRVDEQGRLHVAETIEYDFGTARRHGIFRDVPVRTRYDDRYDRIWRVRDVRVTAPPGTPAQVQEESQGNDLHLRIGDPDRTITGRHVYTIRYVVEGALTHFEDHDELYWNAIGAQWPVPIERAQVHLSLPGAVQRVTCFAGPQGSNLPCGGAAGDGTSARFGPDRLGPFSAFTVVAALPVGVVPTPRPILDERFSLNRAFSRSPATVGGGGAVLLATVLAWARAVRRGRDRRWRGSHVDAALGPAVADGTAIDEPVALFDRDEVPVELLEPPDRLRPGQLGTLVDERAHALDVTATIVDLAVRGHLRIEEIEKKGWFGKPDWNLVERPERGDDLAPYETALLGHLFAGRAEVRVSSLKNTFASKLEDVQDRLYDDVVERGWFSRRPDRVRARWVVLGVLALGAGIAATVALAVWTHAALVAVPLPLFGLLLLASSGSMPARTTKGTAVLRRARGFRRFIEESEKDRAAFAERAHLFTEYLPYAVAFGATERWAKAFEGLDDELARTTGAWYVSSRPFAIGGFADSVDGFATTSTGTIASTPSGSSGFSGGSSGGGGGGGGGGSW